MCMPEPKSVSNQSYVYACTEKCFRPKLCVCLNRKVFQTKVMCTPEPKSVSNQSYVYAWTEKCFRPKLCVCLNRKVFQTKVMCMPEPKSVSNQSYVYAWTEKCFKPKLQPLDNKAYVSCYIQFPRNWMVIFKIILNICGIKVWTKFMRVRIGSNMRPVNMAGASAFDKSLGNFRLPEPPYLLKEDYFP
jgi:hypothetical protein